MRRVEVLSGLQALFVQTLGNLPRPAKRAVQVTFDVIILFAAVWLAYYLRLGTQLTITPTRMLIALAAPLLAVPVFVRMGLYRAVLRYLSDQAMWTIVKAMGLATLLWVALVYLTELYGGEGVPRSVPVLYWFVGVTFVAGSRFLIRRLFRTTYTGGKRVHSVIYGAGQAGSQLLAALRADPKRRVIGFVDDNAQLQRHVVQGLPVYAPARLREVIAAEGVDEVILCVPSAPSARKLEIAAQLAQLPVQVRMMPAVADLASGRYKISALKDIALDELLGRTRVAPQPDLMRTAAQGKCVLVTGAGGSIGSELCLQAAALGPRRLIIADMSEAALFRIEMRLKTAYPALSLRAALLSVTDKAAISALLADEQVDIVFHAAAYKHVPMLEDNVLAGAFNNVAGTRTLAEAALAAGVKHFVLISSDKAVNPANVMGATKRWGELIVKACAAAARARGTGQKFLIVRFGNVLGSDGSVVPIFSEQIARGGPLTVTDPDMTRYFMSIDEAVELIIQAASLSQGGEIFLLDMGEPIRIGQLATSMVRLVGLSVRDAAHPDGDIEIKVVGARPGEKMHEALFYDPARVDRTLHPKIMVSKGSQTIDTDIFARCDRLSGLIAAGDANGARALLFDGLERPPVTPAHEGGN